MDTVAIGGNEGQTEGWDVSERIFVLGGECWGLSTLGGFQGLVKQSPAQPGAGDSPTQAGDGNKDFWSILWFHYKL